MPGILNHPHFEVVQQFSSDFSSHKFTQYVSKRTGMHMVVVDQEGPKVFGNFVLATEIHDDSGSPHTLEHLCFMGSKDYPYKGLLDKVATRGYSATNAWTANDHTSYTLDTAGSNAFLTVLPVYLDHVIRPTLTDAGCYTEVYHVDGEGNDAGVVYSEMQGTQNNGQSIMDLDTNRILYPDGNGFRYETGGLMQALRVLTADRIREFHKEMYQPKNLCLVVCGSINHSDLIKTVDTFEDGILGDVPDMSAPFKRPWVESKQTKPLAKSTVHTSIFPEEDESQGEIWLSYLGPSCTDPVLSTALQVLTTYLAGSSASVLENNLVEKEQLASSVYVYVTERPDTVVQFMLTGVDAKKLSKVADRFEQLVKETAENPLNMVYLADVIAREKRAVKHSAESNAQFFQQSVINWFLFDTRDQDSSLKDLGSMRDYEAVEQWTEKDWIAFLKKWFVDAHHVTCLGKPSHDLAVEIKDEEEKRVAERKERLGENGLRKLQKDLDHAKSENGKEIPKHLLTEHTVHEPGLHFIETITAKAGLAKEGDLPVNRIQAIVDRDSVDLPLYLHYEHIQSNFISTALLISTDKIPVHLRPLLTIYAELFFNSPISRGGKRIEFEEVVMELEKDTVDFEAALASDLGTGEMIMVRLMVESEKYETAIRWIHDLMHSTIFDPERITSSIAKYLADVPDEKRSGSKMVDGVIKMVHSEQSSLARATSTLTKALYLKRLRRLSKEDPEAVIKQLEDLRAALCRPSNFRVFVAANIDRLQRPVSSWKLFTPESQSQANTAIAPIDKYIQRLSPAGQKPGNLSYVVPIGAIDSSFARSVAKGPSDYRDPMVAKIEVAIAYLDQTEGPMWTAIRGTGLAYGIYFNRYAGFVDFEIYRSPDSYKAFKDSRKVLEDFVSGARSFDNLALDGAISSLILRTAGGQSTMGDAAITSFILQTVRDLPKNWQDIALQRMREVTFEDIKEVIKDVLLPLFMPETSNLFVTCAPMMQDALVKGFGQMGYKPEIKTLADFQDDYGLIAPGDDDDDDDEDEDEEGDDDDEDEDEEEDNEEDDEEDDGDDE